MKNVTNQQPHPPKQTMINNKLFKKNLILIFSFLENYASYTD